MERSLPSLVCHLAPALAFTLSLCGCNQSSDSIAIAPAPHVQHQTNVSSTIDHGVLPQSLPPRVLEVIPSAQPIQNWSRLTNTPEPTVTKVASAVGNDESGPTLAAPSSLPQPTLAQPTLAQPTPAAPPAAANKQRPSDSLLDPYWAAHADEQQPQAGHVSQSTASESSDLGSTELPWARQTIKSPEMEAVDQRAEAHIQHGMELGKRGAFFSARSEFTQALQIVASALDMQRSTRAHCNALLAGLQALEEASDFVSRGTQLDAALNLKLIIDSHQTKILHGADLSSMTPTLALQQYYTYAQEQLTVSVGRQASGSKALYALGRLETLMVDKQSPKWMAAAPKAVVFYQASLAVNANNNLAANELGVLLARFGRTQEAKQALLHSAKKSPQPIAWQNLATIHREAGELELAQRAEQEAKLASQVLQQRSQAGGHTIHWVAPETFAQTNRATPELRSPTEAQSAAKPAPASPDGTASGWFPWSKSNRK